MNWFVMAMIGFMVVGIPIIVGYYAWIAGLKDDWWWVFRRW